MSLFFKVRIFIRDEAADHLDDWIMVVQFLFTHVPEGEIALHLGAMCMVVMFPLPLLNFTIMLCLLEPTEGDCSHGLLNTMCLLAKAWSLGKSGINVLGKAALKVILWHVDSIGNDNVMCDPIIIFDWPHDGPRVDESQCATQSLLEVLLIDLLDGGDEVSLSSRM